MAHPRSVKRGHSVFFSEAERAHEDGIFPDCALQVAALPAIRRVHAPASFYVAGNHYLPRLSSTSLDSVAQLSNSAILITPPGLLIHSSYTKK